MSLEKVFRVFFFMFEGSEAQSSKVLSCSYHSAIRRVNDFFCVQQHLETLDRLVYSFSKDHRRKADFKTRLTPTLWAVASSKNEKIIVRIITTIKLLCFEHLQVFSLFVIAIQEGALHNKVRG